jgi:nicotinamide riboside kinase
MIIRCQRNRRWGVNSARRRAGRPFQHFKMTISLQYYRLLSWSKYVSQPKILKMCLRIEPEMTEKHDIKRIAIVGAESCGKTTLAEALASELKSYVVPEYFRFYWNAKKFANDDPIWTSKEFTHIASMQNICEDYAATRSKKILICDTNSFLTSVWHRRYLDFYSSDIDEIIKSRNYDLTLYCPAIIPFVQDGTRDGELIRPKMSGWIKERLESLQIPFVTMDGSAVERLSQALKLIKQSFGNFDIETPGHL